MVYFPGYARLTKEAQTNSMRITEITKPKASRRN